MFAAGGSLSGSVQFWKCDVCKTEIEDTTEFEIVDQLLPLPNSDLKVNASSSDIQE